MGYSLDQLLDRGVALKRSGNLKGAIDCYIKALEIDPYNMMTYISLGKTAHLLKDQDLAVRSYLASTHLQLAPVEKSINENNLPFHLKVLYDMFPREVLSSLPKKSAFIIYIAPNTPRHIAHSIIDLSPSILSEHPQLLPYAEIYRSHIHGNGTHDQILKKYGLTLNDQIEKDEKFYLPFGRKFLLEQLHWDKLSRDDVINIYFK